MFGINNNNYEGVDIPDVRLVLLYGLPASLLQFYQVRSFNVEQNDHDFHLNLYS